MRGRILIPLEINSSSYYGASGPVCAIVGAGSGKLLCPHTRGSPFPEVHEANRDLVPVQVKFKAQVNHTTLALQLSDPQITDSQAGERCTAKGWSWSEGRRGHLGD